MSSQSIHTVLFTVKGFLVGSSNGGSTVLTLGQPPVAQQQAPQPSGSGINNEDLAYLALASPYYGYGGGLVAAAALSGQGKW